MISRLVTGFLLSLSLSATALGQSPQREILAARFQETLATLAHSAPGVVGIAVFDLEGDTWFGISEKLVFPQGSSIKIPILVSLYVRDARGRLDVDEAMTISARDRVGGSGYLRYFGDGTSSLSLHDLSVLMITVSDNMATNMLIDRIGKERVTGIMEELGYDTIKLQRKMIRRKQSARGNENIAAPAEAAALMARILRCELPMDASACGALQDVLAIPHPGPIADGTPPGVRVLQKSGTIAGVRTAWGGVALEGRPYTLAVMGNYGDSAGLSLTIERIAEASHRYFSRLAGATEYGTRVPVEVLQSVREQQ